MTRSSNPRYRNVKPTRRRHEPATTERYAHLGDDPAKELQNVPLVEVQLGSAQRARTIDYKMSLMTD